MPPPPAGRDQLSTVNFPTPSTDSMEEVIDCWKERSMDSIFLRMEGSPGQTDASGVRREEGAERRGVWEDQSGEEPERR